MKNKALVILAASAAALGSAIFTTPANAVQQEVNLSVDVQRAIYLKTFENVDLKISPENFTNAAKQSQAMGTTDGNATLEPYIGQIGGSSGGAVTKSVKELFAVSANVSTDVDVTITGPTVGATTGTLSKSSTSTTTGLADAIQLTGITATNVTGATGTVTGNKISGNVTSSKAFKGGVDLSFNVPTNAQGGIYTGKLYVEAIAK